MEKHKTAVFIGHAECYGLSEDLLRQEILNLIQNGVTTFLNGGMGSFDWICAKIVYELKQNNPYIESFLVIPYLTFHIPAKHYFDEIIYPEGFERYHFKAAIPARNDYLINHSEYALCYVNHTWGGAAKSMEKAIKNGLTIINLGSINFYRENN